MAVTLLFGVLAAVGPVAWLAYNWWMTGDCLDFVRGPYSPGAIQGGATYPGLHDWRAAWLYCRTAIQLCAGPGLVALGLMGIIASLLKRAFWPLVLLALPPAFYVANMHSGASPIFVPSLWPHSYYNVRYGTAALPLLALAAGGLVALVPPRMRPPPPASRFWRAWRVGCCVRSRAHGLCGRNRASTIRRAASAFAKPPRI